MAFVSVGLSQVVAVVTGEWVISTLVPALIGALLHCLTQAHRNRLEPNDFLISGPVAFFTGIWGGPWFASNVPQAALAAPFMCFLAALWSRTVLEGVRDAFLAMLATFLKGLGR